MLTSDQWVSTPRNSINRLAPYESYQSESLLSYFRTVDVMAQYSNTLGVFAGYTVVNNYATENAAPVVAAVVRDLKRYMQARNESTGQRILPVGYGGATTDGRDRELLDYLSPPDEKRCVDFWTVRKPLGGDNLRD